MDDRKIECIKDLEFPCPDSQVLEIKKILETFGRMRDTLKESLMKQWELESARKEQMGALAHDLKTPLTVIRGNVQLMGEAESLEEAQKYSLALEQEIQGIEEYLQILQEMIQNPKFAEQWRALQTMFCQKRTITTTMNTAIMSRIPL